MGTISSGVGLVSGIDSQNIIDQLMSIEERPKNLVQNRIDQANIRKEALDDLKTTVNSFTGIARNLQRVTTFRGSTATSSDAEALGATASDRAAVGSYDVTVNKLASSKQMVSRGFFSENDAVGRGTLTFEMGGGDLTSETRLADLNGGRGVDAGTFRVTDRTGRSSDFTVGQFETLDEVAAAISADTGINVEARVGQNGLELFDRSQQTYSRFIIRDIDGTAAEDLGILHSGTATEVTGENIRGVGELTRINLLRDGLGIDTTAEGEADLSVKLRDGTSFDVDLHGVSTLGEVMDRFNEAADGKAFLEASAENPAALAVYDRSGGGAALSVQNAEGSVAADQLGIAGLTTTDAVEGKTLLASFGSVLLDSLNGGSGIDNTGLRVIDRAGNVFSVDTSETSSLGEIVDAINDVGGNVTASLNRSGNGLMLTDASDGRGKLIVKDINGGSMATDLGLAGEHEGTDEVTGANLQRAWIGKTTRLSSLNGGQGLGTGTIEVFASDGGRFEVDVTDDMQTVGQLLAAFNSAASSNSITERVEVDDDPDTETIERFEDRVTATPVDMRLEINATGDGFVLRDATGGINTIRVSDTEGGVARGLQLAGESEAGATEVEGRYELSFEVGPSKTLAEVARDINDKGLGVQAVVLNDGDPGNPFRLSLTTLNSGREGRVIFDAGETSLNTRTILEASDAVVQIGGEGGGLVVRSSTNEINDAVPGLSLSANRVGGPYTVEVARDTTTVKEQLQTFVASFNEAKDKVASYTGYDAATGTRGILLGESAANRVETELYAAIREVVNPGGRFGSVAQVGLSYGADGLTFDEDDFDAAWAEDREAVTRLFSATEQVTDSVTDVTTTEGVGWAWKLQERLDNLIDPSFGVISRSNRNIDDQNLLYEERIRTLDTRLESKRARLEKQFADLESALSSLQNQQSAVGSFQVAGGGQG